MTCFYMNKSLLSTTDVTRGKPQEYISPLFRFDFNYLPRRKILDFQFIIGPHISYDFLIFSPFKLFINILQLIYE